MQLAQPGSIINNKQPYNTIAAVQSFIIIFLFTSTNSQSY